MASDPNYPSEADLDRLAGFLDALAATGVMFSQEFPDELVVIREGRPTAACDGYVAGAADVVAG